MTFLITLEDFFCLFYHKKIRRLNMSELHIIAGMSGIWFWRLKSEHDDVSRQLQTSAVSLLAKVSGYPANFCQVGYRWERGLGIPPAHPHQLLSGVITGTAETPRGERKHWHTWMLIVYSARQCLFASCCKQNRTSASSETDEVTAGLNTAWTPIKLLT